MKAVQQKWFVIVAMAAMLCLAGLVISGTAFSADGGLCKDNGDGTVTDIFAHLMLQQATAGPMTWDDAMSYASGLSLGGHSDWRLPNKSELSKLYKSECKNFMDVRIAWYWSSTAGVDLTDWAWLVGFGSGGDVSLKHKSNTCYVRAVRSAW